jgi:drug/metabolite transporter (DMT)-like permease
MWAGAAFALAAGMMWGLMFVVPLLLPEYPAALLAVGRYLAFGLIALPLSWIDRAAIARLSRADWIEALKLVAVGNLLYYLCLAGAIQRTGAPLPAMIVGALPVVIAISANLRDHLRDGLLPWNRLAPALLLIGGGIACVNVAELGAPGVAAAGSRLRHAGGVLLALGAVACWTWYPLRNADWLRRHPGHNPRAWSTAQGLAILPLSLSGYLATWIALQLGDSPLSMPFGPRPLAFIGLAAAMGLLSTWLASWCWNHASRRLPTSLAGQFLVFETLAALSYAFLLRGQWPAPMVLAGAALMVGGLLWAVRIRPVIAGAV